MTRRLIVLTIWMLMACRTVADAQSSQTEFERVGAQRNRDYLHLTSFERLDTLTGNVIVTVPIFTLPGNVGRDLQFELTYNANSARAVARPDNTLILAPWTFGLRGVPLRVNNQADPQPGSFIADNIQDTRGITPLLVMGDGAERGMMFRDVPNSNNPNTLRWFVTSDLWKYDRTGRILYAPDGTTYTYDAASGKLALIQDVYGNQESFDWFSVQGQLTVVQMLGNGESRTITFEMNLADLPKTATYLSRTWQFSYDDSGTPDQNGGELREATPPLGPHWFFTYDAPLPPDANRRLRSLTTPHGGRIEYDYDPRYFSQTDYRIFLIERRVLADRGTTPGAWRMDYAYSLSSEYSGRSTIDTPSAHLIYDYGPIVLTNPAIDPSRLIDGGIGLSHSEVQPAGGGSALEADNRIYQQIPAIGSTSGRHFDGPELLTRTITRSVVGVGSRSYSTQFSYSTSNFGDYHHPSSIHETGELTRTITYTYSHPRIGSNADPVFVVGLPASETVTVDSEALARCWQYDEDTGFKNRETEFGTTCLSAIATTFAADAQGNVGSSTDGNGKTTTYTYSYGHVADTNTPLYAVHRVINQDGTVASQTQAGRATGFTYDELGRIRTVQPPGGTNSTITTYDNTSGASTETTRGTSSLTTSLDGFGRPVSTLNSLDVRRTMRYDAEGGLIYDGYPFNGMPGAGTCPSTGDVGTCMEYDELGRVTRKTNADGTYSTRTYGLGTITITDENGHVTTETLQAFGDADDARMTTLVDADSKTWRYAYHALGALWTVQAPDGTLRVWNYNDQNRLSSENHPESGITNYSLYDAAGNLKTKTTANGTTFQYTYDDNNRLTAIGAGPKTTSISYEPGSDNRLTTTDGFVTTTFGYEATTGRVQTKQETIGAYVYTTTYGYDNDDNVTSITYPSGRVINYDFRSEHQITHVYELAAGRDYAIGMDYHSSGGLRTYTGGDMSTTTIGYDAQRYWIRSITSGPLGLTYNDYDGVGNVRTIGDSRAGIGQSVTYDALDRLALVNGPWGSTAYAYDAHGNRQSSNGTSYDYDAHLRMVQQGTSLFGYDANGNLTSAPNATYTYTPEDWLATATVGATTSSYLYDADGWRARKIGGADTTYYLRGLQGELLTEWKNPGPAGHTKEYVYAGSRLLAAVDRDRSTLLSTCGGNAWPDGSPNPVTITTPGGSASVSFQGSACRRISVLVNVSSGNLGCIWNVTLRGPNNATIASVGTCGGTNFIEPVVLPFSGTYTVTVTAQATSSGSATVRIYDVVDISASALVDGSGVPVTFTTPGQRASVTFSGTAGHMLTAVASVPNGCLAYPMRILDPNGASLASTTWCGTTYIKRLVLPTSGIYTVSIDPNGADVGGVTLRLYEVVDITASAAIDGPGVPITFTTPGQRASVTFSGTAGHMLTAVASVPNGCLAYPMRILDPNGVSLASTTWCGTTYIERLVLLTSGVYTITIDPNGTDIGGVTILLYDIVDIATTIALDGPGVPIQFTKPTQRGLLTFDGVAGHTVAVVASVPNGCLAYPMKVLNSNDASLGSTSWCGTVILDHVTLDGPGPYTVLLDPNGLDTGSATVNIYDTVDFAGTLSINGGSILVSLPKPGEVARLTFNGSAGQQVTVRITGNQIGYTNVALKRPDQSTQASFSWGTESFNMAPESLGSDGIYTVVVDPSGTGYGNINVAVTSP